VTADAPIPLGLLGERIAARWLIRRGWSLIDHHFRVRRGEIDLIVRRASLVAFVEVKTRSRLDFGLPIECIPEPKQRRILHSASVWISRFGVTGESYRFDVIGVAVCGKASSVTYVENAFCGKV
jgi:putative endonuclease